MKNKSSLLKTRMVTLLAIMLVCTPFFAKAALLTRQLQQGMSGSDVSDLQAFLARDVSIYPSGLVTGYFGALTKAAVVNFQARYSIQTVGRVGPATLAAINSQMLNAGSPASPQAVIQPLTINASSNQATLSWATTRGAMAWVYYSTSPINVTEATEYSSLGISGTSATVNTGWDTSHSVTLTGLSPGTRYYYVAYVKDSTGTEHITLPASFVTSN